MMQAQMIVAVIQPRLATGGGLSPLTARACTEIAARRRAYSSAAIGCRAAIIRSVIAGSRRRQGYSKDRGAGREIASQRPQ
jgi:hypothetical protein